MKKSCKHIDVTNPETVKPYIRECLCRHKKRGATKKLLLNDFDVTTEEYNRLLDNDAGTIDTIAGKISEYVARKNQDQNDTGLSPDYQNPS